MTSLLVAAFAAFGLASPASTPSFAPALVRVPLHADLPLKVPAGWKREETDGSTVLTPSDVPAGKSYAVVVTRVEGKAGSLDEILEAGTKKIGEVGDFKPAIDPRRARTDGGWDYALILGMIDLKDRQWVAQVTALKKGDEGAVLIVLSDSVETMTQYADALATMVRAFGAGAPASAPTPTQPGTAGLQYVVPTGWVESRVNGFPSLVKEKNEVWTKYRMSLLVLAPEARAGSVREQFQAQWNAFVAPNYQTKVVPLPLMSRLGSGYACAFDGDLGAVDKSGATAAVTLFMLAQGDRVVPILGIFAGSDWSFDKDAEPEIGRFLESVRIPGASAEKVALFAADQLAGEWSESSAEYATYVTRSGAYAGDASIATGAYFNLAADGTYARTLTAISSGRHIREKDTGTWSVEDDELVLSKGGRYSLLGYGADSKAGRFLVIGNYSNVKSRLKLTNPRGILQAMWLRAK